MRWTRRPRTSLGQWLLIRSVPVIARVRGDRQTVGTRVQLRGLFAGPSRAGCDTDSNFGFVRAECSRVHRARQMMPTRIAGSTARSDRGCPARESGGGATWICMRLSIRIRSWDCFGARHFRSHRSRTMRSTRSDRQRYCTWKINRGRSVIATVIRLT